MVILILISLQAIIAITAGNGFQYIGSFRSRMSVQGRSTQLFDESNYYISQNWGACNTAQKDCKNLLNANLLAVETEEEWKYVREMLKNYGFATAYWTSGEYARTDWRWSANDIALAPFAPWESGHPKKANPLLSVLINYRNRYDATWSTVPNTQLHRYICEEKLQAPSAPSPAPSSATSPAPPYTLLSTPSHAYPFPVSSAIPFTVKQVPPILTSCYQTSDLVIVLDVMFPDIFRWSYYFERAKELADRLASTFTTHSENRISFVTYSHYAATRIDMTNSLSPVEVSSKILTTDVEAGNSCNILSGIQLATEQLLSNYRGVTMNMVIFTGFQSDSPYETTAMAKEAIDSGIRTFSVGITPHINDHELREMAGFNTSRIFTTADYDDVNYWWALLSNVVCRS
ncbi:uncharacterized protein LOC119082937 [Bradysia coprophila]|uniref:uncharacterized protein LOC119082937 n=1 Tax=Bradysia coprophila TaxID=38358 RepID=UPI00187D76A5|nr:uncharacterized protein LOC119082937 [Bradysia coprophila]